MSTITGVDAYSNVQTGAPDDGSDPQAGHIRAVSQVALNNTKHLFEHSVLDTTDRPAPGNDGAYAFGDGVDQTIGFDGSTGNIFCRTFTAIEADGDGRVLIDGTNGTLVLNNSALNTRIALDGQASVAALYDAANAITITASGLTGIVAAAAGFYRASTSYDRVTQSAIDDPNWTPLTDNLTLPPKARFVQQSNTIDYLKVFIVDPPHGATWTGAKVWIDPANGHVSLPAQKPRLRVYACDQTAGDGDGGTPILDVTDAPGSIAAYEVGHDLTATGGVHVVDRTKYVYLAIFTGEIDASFGVPLLQVAWPRYVFTRLQVGEE